MRRPTCGRRANQRQATKGRPPAGFWGLRSCPDPHKLYSLAACFLQPLNQETCNQKTGHHKSKTGSSISPSWFAKFQKTIHQVSTIAHRFCESTVRFVKIGFRNSKNKRLPVFKTRLPVFIKRLPVFKKLFPVVKKRLPVSPNTAPGCQ